MSWSRHLHVLFISAALLVALTAGFGYGAFLATALAFGMTPGAWYGALVQAHGHAQLFGWVGLFVLGMGLYFLPRLRGTNLRDAIAMNLADSPTLDNQENLKGNWIRTAIVIASRKGIARLPYAFGLLVAGIVLRSVVQPLAGIVGTSEILRALFLLSAILEMGGMVVIISMLAPTRAHASKQRSEGAFTQDAAAYSVEPLTQLALISLALAFLFNLFGVWNVVSQVKHVLAPRYDQLVINLILYGVALPMTFVFSIRNLPLFLRLAVPPRGIWRTLTNFYLLGLGLRVLPYFIGIADDALVLTGRVLRANFLYVLLFDALALVGVILLNACILIFVLAMALPHLRKPSRANFPESGGYGRFELLIYAAFVWLVVGASLDVLRVLPYVNEMISIPQDAARHALFVGFLTLLIFGMAVRMTPGFSGKRALADPALVTWLFVLGNTAALLRVAPTFFSQSEFALLLWGLSGFSGWCAVLVLAIGLWRTFR